MGKVNLGVVYYEKLGRSIELQTSKIYSTFGLFVGKEGPRLWKQKVTMIIGRGLFGFVEEALCI